MGGGLAVCAHVCVRDCVCVCDHVHVFVCVLSHDCIFAVICDIFITYLT